MEADFDAPHPRAVASLLMASAHSAARGDLEGALRSAQDARAAGPRSAAAALREAELQAELARRSGDESAADEARATIEQLAQTYPDEPAPRMAGAELALLGGRQAEAMADARALVIERPDWAPPHVLLAKTLLGDDPEQALHEAERAVELAPNDGAALGVRARANVGVAEYDDARSDARRALRARPDVEVTRAYATALLQIGDPKGALAQAESVLEADRPPRLELIVARAEWAEKDPAAATKALDRAAKRAEGDPALEAEILSMRADLETSEGRLATAVSRVDAARDAHPEDAALQELAARTEISAKLLSEARASARRAVELAPGRPSAWQTLASATAADASKAPAREQALAAFGGADGPRVDALAGMLLDGHDAAAARTAYEAALARDPGLSVAKLRLARLLAGEKQDPSRATQLAESARKEIGWSPETGEALGAALLVDGRAKEAVMAFKIGIARLPAGTLAGDSQLVELATALAHAGDTDRARSLVSGVLARSKKEAGAAQPWRPAAEELAKQLAPPPRQAVEPEPSEPTEPSVPSEQPGVPSAPEHTTAPAPKPAAPESRPN